MRAVTATLLLCGAAVLAACGGDDTEQPAPAQFAVYDWEPSVIRPSGAPEPAAREATDVPVSRSDAAGRAKAARGRTVTLAERGRGSWVLRDRPALTAADVASARQEAEQPTGEPIVVLELIPAGRAKLKRLTQGVAARGRSRHKSDGTSIGPGPASFEHFAIVLDRRLVWRPGIDPVELPGGLNGRNGIQLHLDGNIKQAQDVAEQIEAAR